MSVKMRTKAIFLLYVVVRHFYFKNLTGATVALLSIFYGTPFLSNRILPLFWLIFEVRNTYQVGYQMKADNFYIANIATKSGMYTHIHKYSRWLLIYLLLIRPPGTVVPGGLMFCCGFFFFFCGTLRRYISEMAGAIALKLSHMIGSVWT